MAKITRLEQQKKDKARVSVYIDGAFYCGIKLAVAVQFHLKEGMEITKERLDEIQLETEKTEALEKALTRIAATMKTQKQMRDYLVGKGYTEAVVAYVMERLNYYGYLDDVAYCCAYVNSVSGKGKRAIEANLIKRGADKKAIEEVLAETKEDSSEAVAVAKKYLRGKVIDKANKQKAYRYLLSKGFSYDTAKDALESLDKGEDFEDDDDSF